MFTHNGKTIPLAPTQDPDKVDTWGADWSEFLLEGEYLVGSIWLLDSDLATIDETCTLTHTSMLMRGGVIGRGYTVTNRIKTNGGSTIDKSMFIKCIAN